MQPVHVVVAAVLVVAVELSAALTVPGIGFLRSKPTAFEPNMPK
jgi:hypothetical protein